MAVQKDGVVLQAIANVRGRYTPDEWSMISPHQTTAEIYREVRRLDLLRIEAGMSSANAPTDIA